MSLMKTLVESGYRRNNVQYLKLYVESVTFQEQH